MLFKASLRDWTYDDEGTVNVILCDLMLFGAGTQHEKYGSEDSSHYQRKE
jgi:hypothetical protein